MLALVSLAYVAISVGLSLLAAKLLEKRNKAIAQDDKPTTLATRGSFVPRVIGRRRVGAVWAWAGDRGTTKEKQGKKGGLFSTPEVDIFRETAWHLLAVGPGRCLHSIEQSGQTIFQGPITPDSHPSGSTIDLGNEGSFRIFWGEVDQPVNTFLGDPARVPAIGVSSRWPHFMYIEWRSKRLSQQPVWPLLTYDIEVAPAESHLSDTEAYQPPTFVLDGGTHAVLDRTNGVEGVGFLQFRGDVSADFPNKGRVRLTGNTGIPDQDFDVFKMTVTLVQTGTIGAAMIPQFEPRTNVFPVGGLTGADVNGNLQGYTTQPDDGYNLAHILAELWFSKWPHGIKRNKARFDMTSLEALGTLIDTEDYRGSVIAQDGQDLRATMANIHQDLGVMLPMNFRTGLLQFQPVREPTSAIPNIPDDAVIEVPEIDTSHRERSGDRLVFSFQDRENAFRDMTIGIDGTGQASFQEYFRAKSVRISSTVNFDSAAIGAERRSQEELAGGAEHRLVCNRGARLLLPGTQVTQDSISEVLLITKVEPSVNSSKVTITVVPDFMAAQRTGFTTGGPVLGTPVEAVEPDPQFQAVEVPEWLGGQEQSIIMARLRAHNQVEGAFIHISRDGSTFTGKGLDTSIMQGGTLIDEMSADDLWEQDDGPTFTALGPDIASVLDLSSDLTSWRNGRQLAVIGEEIFFVQTIESLGGGVYRLKGLIRARYDTRPAAHAADSEVYILQNDDGLPITDVLIEPQVLLLTKSQASGRGVVPLSSVTVEGIDLYGKGVRPVPVEEIRFDTLSDPAGVSTRSWVGTGSTDLVVTWGYFTPQSTGTGAGFAGAGVPQAPADPEGSFLVEILDSGDVVQRSDFVSTNSFTYTEDDRTADFGGEPATFKVRVTQQRAGLSADPVTQTFTRI